MSKSNSFCVSFDKLEPAAIQELHKVHPGALPISTEWKLSGNSGAVVIWWVPSPKQKFEWCDGCDGTGLMEGWNRRDGYPCPKCKGSAKVKV